MQVGELSARIRLDGKPEFDRGVDDSGRRFQNLGTRAKDVGQSMATAFVAATGTVAGLGIAAFKTGIEYNALQQSSRAALETLLGSAEAANAQMDKLDEFASNSPFAKDVFIRAQQQMIGFGIAAEDVIPILGAVQDATAAVGGTNQDISDIVTTLSKISSTGKITAQDLNELGNKGIDAAGLIGKEFGKTGGEIRDMITKGEITADEAINAITGQMSEQFGGAAANVKETWVGAVDRIKAAWRDTGAALAAPFVDPQGGGKAITWANDFADVLRAVQKQVEPIMGVVMDRWGKDLDKISPYLQNLKTRIDSLDMSALNESLDALDGYGPIIAGLTASFTAWGTAALPIIGGINPLVAGVTALVMATPELRDGIGGVLTAAAPLVDMMGDLGVEVADLAMQVLNTVAPAFIDLAEAVVNASIPLAGTMTDAISGIIHIAEPLVGVLADVIGWISELPDEVLLAGTAFALLRGNLSPVAGAVNKVRTAFDNFQLQRHLGQMEGMSSASATASVAMHGLSTSVQRVGTAMKTAFLTNAPALAIAGLVSILGHFSSKSAEAEALVENLAQSLDEVTGAATDATKALLAAELEDRGILKAYEEAGGNVEDFIIALTQTGPAADEARARIEAIAGSFEDYGNAMIGTHNDGEKFVNILEELGGAMTQAEEEQRRLNDATSDTSGIDEQSAARERLSDLMRDEVGQIESLIDARRREQNELLGVVDAQGAHARAIETMQRALEDESVALDQATGKWDMYTSAGQTAHQGSVATRDAMLDMAEAMAMEGESAQAVTTSLAGMRDGFIETAMQMGATEEQANALADSYGLFPEKIATEAVFDAEQAKLTMDDLKIEIDELEGEPATVTIDGNPAPLDATLAEVVGEVNESDGTVTINGNRLPADMTVAQLLNTVNNSEGTSHINAEDSQARKRLLNTVSAIDRSTGVLAINGNASGANTARERAVQAINQAQGRIRIEGNRGPLDSVLGGIRGHILGTAYIRLQSIGGGNLAHNVMADGGVLEFYASGGLRENHVAQIAPAGAWRVWAEPETGGEAYIPLSQSKRARSEQILAEVADRFNLMVVPKDTDMYAGGNLSTGRDRQSNQNRFPSGVGGFPRVITLRVGEREMTGYIEEVVDARPGVAAANDFVSVASRFRKGL